MKKEKLDIIFEDKFILAVNKPCGLLTVSTASEKEKTLYHKVREYLRKKNQQVFIVHRLDKDTSGVVIFAKNMKVKKILQDNWNSTLRYYHALVHGIIKEKEGELKYYLKEDKYLNVLVTNNKHDFLAITKYNVISYRHEKTFLDIQILTGKKHQIRVSLAHINHPIVGDRKYGIKDGCKKMYLNAYKIILNHPISKEKLCLEKAELY